MACYHPWRAWQGGEGGKPSSSFRRGGRKLALPCGQCIGCRLEYSRQWAIRCVHEAQMWPVNCFITLTYDKDHLPKDYSLQPRDLELFWKKFRKFSPVPFRYYACGEYGEEGGRPHYHACVFNFDFLDKELIREGEFKLYTSKKLEELWENGLCSIGEVSFESAAYVARYVAKKVTGDVAAEHYRFVDGDGVVHDRHPEFARMSLKPGIGRYWLEKFHEDVYPEGEVVSRGRLVKPPRYYENVARDAYFTPREFKALQGKRLRLSEEKFEDNSTSRLGVREHVAEARFKLFHREI